MSLDPTPVVGNQLPIASGRALSNVERRTVESAIAAGTAVWVWSDQLREWVMGVVESTELLEDRCLFEVRCERSIGSSFLGGRGSCQRSGFHGIDWHFRYGEDPPPTHPLAAFPSLMWYRWFRINDDDQPIRWQRFPLLCGTGGSG